ncbi:MAG: hypothetical protein AAF655_16290 [Bacteroidota bacterium]
MHYRLFIFLTTLLLGCSPSISVKNITPNILYPPLQAYDSFGIIEIYDDRPTLPEESLIGILTSKNKGIGKDCSYKVLRQLAMEEAKQAGGNCLIITESRFPGNLLDCHKIEGLIYRIPNPGKYEKEFNWHPQRRLTISDFKGSYPEGASTSFGHLSIAYTQKVNVWNGRITLKVHSVFHSALSYFSPPEFEQEYLAIEQLSFDLYELSARKMVKDISQNKMTYNEFMEYNQKLESEFLKEFLSKREEMYAELSEDINLLPKWESWVSQELASLSAYTEKIIQF